MSRIRLIVLSIFAVFAVGAFAASSASAACSDGGTNSVFCFHTNVEIHEELALGVVHLSLLSGVLGSTTTKIHCKDGTFHGKILLLGTGNGIIKYLGCTVEKPTGCTVVEPIEANVNSTLSVGVMPATGTFTGAGLNEKYTSITLNGASCAVKGTFDVNGSQLVELPGGETSKVVHEIVANKTGSHLKFGGNVASYSGTALIHLASELAWLIMLGT